MNSPMKDTGANTTSPSTEMFERVGCGYIPGAATVMTKPRTHAPIPARPSLDLPLMKNIHD